MKSKRIGCVTAAAALSAIALVGESTAAQAQADDQTVTQLRDQVRLLQEQVDELRSHNNQHWLTEKRADEIKALVHDVLADADTRASLLQSGAVAGWDKGFFLASTDGNWKLVVGGQFQFRYVFNIQEDGEFVEEDGKDIIVTPVDRFRSGFEARRAKFWFKGFIVDPSWTYDFQFAASRSTGNVALEDAGWMQKDFGNGWKVRIGQQKAPFMREEVLSSARMLTVERSLVNSIFTAGTVQGVQLAWEGDQFRAYGMFHDGNSTANTEWSRELTEWAASGRLEWLASGEWRNFADYNSFRDEGSGVLVGVAANWSKQEFGTGLVGSPAVPNNAEVENLGFTADVTADLGGLNLSGAVFYRNLQVDATGAEMDQFGFLVRGGFFVSDDIELYGQYEWAEPDIDGMHDLSIATVGVTKYWNKHNLKWQTDLGYSFNSLQTASHWLTSGGLDAAGWRVDPAGIDGQIVIRSQIQLLF